MKRLIRREKRIKKNTKSIFGRRTRCWFAFTHTHTLTHTHTHSLHNTQTQNRVSKSAEANDSSANFRTLWYQRIGWRWDEGGTGSDEVDCDESMRMRFEHSSREQFERGKRKRIKRKQNRENRERERERHTRKNKEKHAKKIKKTGMSECAASKTLHGNKIIKKKRSLSFGSVLYCFALHIFVFFLSSSFSSTLSRFSLNRCGSDGNVCVLLVHLIG